MTSPSRPRRRSGAWIVVAIVLLGAGLGFIGLMLRGARGQQLPLQPGVVVLVTIEGVDLGDVTAPVQPLHFANGRLASGSQFLPNLAALMTGLMPRDNGCVRDGDRLDDGVPTMADLFGAEGLATAAFVSGVEAKTKAGVLRGFASVDADAKSGEELGARALEWIDRRGRSASYAWVDFDERGDARAGRGGTSGAAASLVEALLHGALLEHGALLVVSLLPADGVASARLFAPITALQDQVDGDPFVLADVAPSLLELFGVRTPSAAAESASTRRAGSQPMGQPFLLHPVGEGPHWALTTWPMQELAEFDEVEMATRGVEYVCRPSVRIEEAEGFAKRAANRAGARQAGLDGSPVPKLIIDGLAADDAAAKEARELVERVFGYRYEVVPDSVRFGNQVVGPCMLPRFVSSPVRGSR